jgi:hypothetical protein
MPETRRHDESFMNVIRHVGGGLHRMAVKRITSHVIQKSVTCGQPSKQTHGEKVDRPLTDPSATLEA